MYTLAPSLLAADFTKLGEQIEEIRKEGISILHIDVMDGVFVPSISFGMPLIESIRSATDQFFDVHLMIVEPSRYIEEFARCGANGITFHLEAAEKPADVIRQIRACGCKVGMSIKPGTPLEDVYPYLPQIDVVLIMSVEPGFGGQVFMPEAYDRIAQMRRYIDSHCLPVKIEVDGGIGKKNVKEVLQAGTDICVAGSAVFKKRSISENIAHFKDAFAECERSAGKAGSEVLDPGI